jgi:hypothetical protein
MKSKCKPGLTIVIMAHERQLETLRAANAILKVNFGCETEIIVSDNPSTPHRKIENIPTGIEHKVRNPPGSSYWHVKQILQEVDREWTLLTHDDDEMLPRLGELFRQFSSDSEVMMITGKSRILVNGIESFDQGYLSRLEGAGLIEPTPVSRTDLFESLFDLGPLFPASAMIVRTEFLRERSKMNPDFGLAGDLAQSMEFAYNAKVIFDGGNYVMNYHIHGANSVFSPTAAGGLMSDFTILRLSEAMNKSLEISLRRHRMLSKAVLISRILAKSFHLNERYLNVTSYAREFNKAFPKNKINPALLIPLPLGPFKIIVRRLMWRRLGVKRWGF